ncbi:hypothetical protein MnTg02_00642 [bacterium MnTg02]|nr:hypothetical protein MnTg02_00642 [bacterium MnTg02]
MTRSLQTMIDRATVATMTMAVAADSPPIKASSVTTGALADMGSARTNISASTLPFGKVNSPAMAMGTTNRLIRMR